MYYNKRLKSVIKEQIWKYAPQLMLKRIKGTELPHASSNFKYNMPVVGIFKDLLGLYENYVNAANDLKVPYRIVDLMSSDWLRNVKECGSELFFAWPNPYQKAWKDMWDERILIIEKELGYRVYPRFDEIWFWESKRRMSYWLSSHDIPTPKTWVFYNYDEAVDFSNSIELPIVFKPDFGDCARGVEILRSRRRAVALAKKAFQKGFYVEGHHPHDRVWGCAIFQEFIPNAREWRVVKIGDSLFCQLKGKKGDFHSGTRLVEYEKPTNKILDFAMDVCVKGQLDCMSIDILKTNNQYYALELQTVFGIDPWIFYMAIDGMPGRYHIINNSGGYQYNFEHGIFCENQCCNLRIRDALQKYYYIEVEFWEKPGDLDKYLDIAKNEYRHLIKGL